MQKCFQKEEKWPCSSLQGRFAKKNPYGYIRKKSIPDTVAGPNNECRRSNKSIGTCYGHEGYLPH